VPIEGAVLFMLLPVKEVCTKGSNSFVFIISFLSISKYESDKFGSVHSLQYQLSDVLESRSYSTTGKFIHFIWCNCSQTDPEFLSDFFYRLEHFPHGYFTGPGFRAISPDSIKSLISDD
jgi:hypothetical protein